MWKQGEAPWEQNVEQDNVTDTGGWKQGEAPWEIDSTSVIQEAVAEEESIIQEVAKEEEEQLVPEMEGFSPSQIEKDITVTKDQMLSANAGRIESDVKQVYNRYSTMLKEVKGLWSEEDRIAAEKDIALVQQNVLKEMKLRGIEGAEYIDGQLYVTNENGEKVEANQSILRDMLESKFELGGAVAGGIAGAKMAPVLGHPIATLASKATGTLVGSALGAFTGSGVDTLINDISLVQEVNAKIYYDKMVDAGVTDIVFGTAALPIGWTVAQAAKLSRHVFRTIVNKNIKGAEEALLNQLDITREEAVQKVAELENLIGPLRGSEEEKIIYTLTRTQRGAEDVVRVAGVFNAKAQANILNNVRHIADDLQTKAKSLTADNVQTIVRQNLDSYITNVQGFYNQVKHAPEKLTEGYRFDYDALGVKPIVDSIGQAIENPVIKQRYADLMTKIGNASEGRTFTDLIDLRQSLNEIKYATKTIKARDKKALDNALQAVDNEIDSVITNRLGDKAEAWKTSWSKAKEEYSKMKALEKNVLYKALTRAGIDEEGTVKFLAKYIKAGDNTFYEVMEKLPKNVRSKIDGAVLNTLVEKYTVHGATNFAQLTKELNKVNWNNSSRKAQQLVRTIKNMGKVFKNDVHLVAASSNITLPGFQSYLTTDPIVRLKFEIASSIFNYAKMLAPTEQSQVLALANNVGKVFDNPLDFKSVDGIIGKLPKDARTFRQKLDAEPLIKELQQTYIERKQALEALYGKGNMPPRLVWKRPLEAPVTMQESLDKVLYATEKGTIADDPTTAIMKDRTDELISDFIWQNTTRKDIDIVGQAAKYMDNAKFENIAKNVHTAMKVGERQRNANMLKNIVNHQANQLIKQINKDFGVQLPKEEADKLIQLKFKELMEQCDGM